MVERLSFVFGGDHEKGAFWLCFCVIIKVYGIKDLFYKTASVADVFCKKDSGDILEKTILPMLTKDLKKISESKVTIQYESGNAGKIVCGLITKTSPNPNRARTVDHVTMYVTGDLAWLAAMLGKEEISSQWCHLCRLLKTQWAEEGHKLGEHWSFAKLCEMVDTNLSGKNRMGVKTKPYWDIIPFEN